MAGVIFKNQRNGEIVPFSIENRLKNELDTLVKPALLKKDKDIMFIIDGQEGSGKSTFSTQLACYVDPTFCLDRICFTAEEFRDAVLFASKGQAVIFDEGFVGLSSRSSLSEVNRMLVSLMMQCRQKNLFILINLPTFFLLDRYPALWRSRGLFHVIEYKNGRRMWIYYDRRKKERMYLLGKKTYSYKVKGVRSFYRGYFYGKHIALGEEDDIIYRKKKEDALMKVERSTLEERGLKERNDAIRKLREEGKPYEELEKLFNLSRVQLSNIVNKKDK